MITQSEHKIVREAMLNRLWNIFGEPKTNDLESFIDEYIKALSKFSRDQLEEGTDILFQSIKFTRWPTIAECMAAASKAAAAIYERNNPRRTPSSVNHAVDLRTIQERRALSMIKGPIGARAAKDGWIVGLHDFVRDHGRLPDSDDERRLIDSANFVRECAAGTVDMGFLHGRLQNLAMAMMARRQRLSADVMDQQQGA